MDRGVWQATVHEVAHDWATNFIFFFWNVDGNAGQRKSLDIAVGSLNWYNWTSLVVQWIRIRRQCRGHGIDPWSGAVPYAVEQLNLCATISEPNYWAYVPQPHALGPHTATTEARAPRAYAPKTKKAMQLEAFATQQRVALAHPN